MADSSTDPNFPPLLTPADFTDSTGRARDLLDVTTLGATARAFIPILPAPSIPKLITRFTTAELVAELGTREGVTRITVPAYAPIPPISVAGETGPCIILTITD